MLENLVLVFIPVLHIQKAWNSKLWLNIAIVMGIVIVQHFYHKD